MGRADNETGGAPLKRGMPKWTKAPDALVALFGDAIKGLPGVEARKMFGYPAAFVNGNMFSQYLTEQP